MLKPDVVLQRLDEATILRFTKRKNEVKKRWNSSGTHRPAKRRIAVLHNTGPYFCDKCGKSFKNRKAIYHHVKFQHLVRSFLYCDLCPKSFNLKSSLEYHMLQDHSKEKLACIICEHRSENTTFLKEHMRQVHPEKKECQICHKFVKVMSQHLKIVHSDKQYLTCKICGIIIKGRFNMKNHVDAIHGKNHKCDQCGEGFNFYDLRT